MELFSIRIQRTFQLVSTLQGDARDRWNDAAYHASAFEMEAYAHEAEANYLSSRRWFAFVKYYGKL